MSEGKSLLDEILDEMDKKEVKDNVIHVDFKTKQRKTLSSKSSSDKDVLYTFKALVRLPKELFPKPVTVIAYVREGETPKEACFRWGKETGFPVVAKLWHTKTTIEDMQTGSDL